MRVPQHTAAARAHQSCAGEYQDGVALASPGSTSGLGTLRACREYCSTDDDRANGRRVYTLAPETVCCLPPMRWSLLALALAATDARAQCTT